MSVIVSVRNGDVVHDTHKNYAKDVVEAMIGQYPKITNARVTLNAEKARCFAEVLVTGKNLNVESKEETYDMREAIDSVARKLDTQLRKHFEKVQDHHKPAKKLGAKSEAEATEADV